MSQEDDDVKKKNEETTKPFWRQASFESRLTELIEKMSERVEVNEQKAGQRDEKNRRNIDFILQQQAQFTADMQQMREAQAHAEETWERRWGRTEEGIRALLAIAELHDGEIKTLAETQAQAAQTQAQARTDRQMSETDERLNALVNVVERISSERRNGGTGAV
jgi:hypothetical protein